MKKQKEPVTKDDRLDVNFLAGQLAKKWYWFAISIPICLALAYLYNSNTQLIHMLEAKMLVPVSEDRLIYSEDAIAGLNSQSRTKTVENEIAVLKSRDLISRALDSLEVNVNYYKDRSAKQEIKWEDLPIKVEADFQWADRIAGVPFLMEFNKDESFDLSVLEGQDIGNYNIGDTLEYDGFRFTIEHRPGQFFAPLPDFPILFYVNSDDAMVRHFSNALNVMESDRDTDAITLSMNETVKERGLLFLGELLHLYAVQLEEERKEIAQHTYDFIEERLRLNFGDLDSIEFKIDQYKVSQEVSMPDIEAKYTLEGIKKFEIELNDAETQKDIVDELVNKALSSPRQEMDLSIPVTMLGVNDPLLNDMIIDLNRKQYKLKTLSKTVHPDNPLFLEMKAEVDDLRGSVMVDLLNMQENMNTTVQFIRTQIATYKQQLERMSLNEKDLTSMERLRDNKEELFVYLLKKREEAAIVLASELIDNSVMEKPHEVGAYYEPKRSIVLLIGLFMGIFIPLSFLLLWMVVDNKVRSLKTIRSMFMSPVIGEIGRAGKKASVFTPQFMDPVLLEDYKKLYFNILHENREYKSIMFSSMNAGEGKSFNAANLAHTMTMLGKKVCLLDMDLRKGRLSDTLGFDKNHEGLFEVLEGKKTWKEVVSKKNEFRNYDFIPSGVQLNEPTRALSSNHTIALLDALKKEYDMIIMDTPPVMSVADAVIISPMADMNIMVIREGHSSFTGLKELKMHVSTGRLKNVALLFNESSTAVRDAGYIYGYEKVTWLQRIKSIFSKSEKDLALGRNS